MGKEMTILYEIGDELYVNVTNRCPCACIFCIRKNGDGAYGSDSLWLMHEPAVQEFKEEVKKHDITKYREIVYCGYGEPMERPEFVRETALWLKENYNNINTRINTNGLADLINKKPTAEMLRDAFDTVSISLNASCEEEYNKVTRPSLDGAFEAMLKFAKECKNIVPKVVFTVVDIISEDEIDKCKKLTKEMGIPLRVRIYQD